MKLRDKILSRLNETHLAYNDWQSISPKDFKARVKSEVEKLAKSIKKPNSNWIRKSYVNEIVVSYRDGKYPEIWKPKDSSYTIILINEKDGINLIFKIFPVGEKSLLHNQDHNAKMKEKFPNSDHYKRDMDLVQINGSTEFTMDGKWFSYDRRGVEDSFYIDKYGQYRTSEDIPRLIKDQLEKVNKSRERNKNVITDVPHMLSKFRRTPDELSKEREQLRTKGSIFYSPPGFGVGFKFSTKPFPHASKAPKDVEDYFAVGPLWFSRIDMD